MITEKIKQKKVSTEDLMELKIGDEVTFHVPSTLDVETARGMAYRLARLYPERGIKYKSIADFKKLLITISAISNQ